MKNEIKFIEGQPYNRTCGRGYQIEHTPIIMVRNDKKWLVRSIIKNSVTKENINDLKKLELIKEFLINNNGDYYVESGEYKNPFELLEWVKENNYTLEVTGELFETFSDSGVDFHGNLKERSQVFWFRIYNEDIVNELKEITKEMKKHYFS